MTRCLGQVLEGQLEDDTPCGLVVAWLGKDKERALDIARMMLFATTAL